MGKRIKSALAARVRHIQHRGRHLRHVGGDIDDLPLAGLDHQGRYILCHQPRADDVYAVNPLPVLYFPGVPGSDVDAEPDSGVIDQDIHLAVLL